LLADRSAAVDSEATCADQRVTTASQHANNEILKAPPSLTDTAIAGNNCPAVTNKTEVIAMRKLIPIVGPILAAVLSVIPIVGPILAAVVA
jgi:hypothetical protein